ncbi:UDP-N-acetylmuramoyl-tripeptide--D-alanyl-D-alanine ligase [Acidihalobacter prosperus]|uniref:UDP-N-acetylmuramoyl-tripeptide--D-alanyl-D-alanine ligase n=1 Tax=Acidihalobacter prosperus TaxID=160660 RepID=A0A1A6C3D9_9GAMM|nr:UDP-N-acetylmuramoyl-tripeptide--D-alanyl-D-alanine ligase [Acidihalobacter prosperus]OBS09077.1 UDP-N-acetylmuramoylalanyl-D-glutamyl-2,6-diaminopimelate--D-alanyl-D-alanine ligase [Acidihalobacter prosperus]
MNRWPLSQVAVWSQGRLQGDDVSVTGVGTDSRTLSAGALFVALAGARFDGHDYIGPQLPAAALMVSRPVRDARPQVLVDDTLAGLARFAGAWRGQLAARVIGLTGSNGKTTVKEMLASILAQAGPTQYTRGNLNNHIGVPLSLLTIEPSHRYAVIEMGANHAGEIAALTAMVRPQVALVNNAGPAHLEGFGDLAGVARAKGEIYGGLPADGVAVVNADDAFAGDWLALNRERRVLRFGLEQPAEIRGEYRQGHLRVDTPGGAFELQLPLPGRHNAMNALAATAAALGAGVGLDAVRAGLTAVRPVAGRLRRLQGSDGIMILDDTYNANPGSLSAGLDVLTEQPGRHWLVLGDMAELGDTGPALHREAGARARAADVERLFTLGRLSHGAAEAFGAGAIHCPDIEALAAAVVRSAEVAPRPLTVLIKGSRSMGLERLLARLLPDDDESGAGGHHAV